MDWSDVVPHITGLCHLATADGAGHPAVAVVSAIVEDEVIWVSTRSTSRKARNLAENPAVAMMWQSGAEVYVWGSVEVVRDVATKERLWTAWPYDAGAIFGSAAAPDVVLLRVHPTRATVLTAGDSGPVRSRWSA